jgi:hypothetical protein
MRTWLAVACLSVVGALTRPALPAQSTPPASEIEISYETRLVGTYGPPDYKVTLRTGGSVTFECKSGCLVGTQTFRIPDAEVIAIAKALDAAAFFDIPRDEHGIDHSDLMDLTYQIGQRVHQVVRIGTLPVALKDIPARVRQAARVDLLIEPTVDSYRQLVTLKWKPTSTALKDAVTRLDIEATSYLLAQGAPIEPSLLVIATHISPEIAALMRAEVRDPASKKTGRLLMSAAGTEDLEAVRLLLEWGVNVNYRDADWSDETPLMLAVRSSHPVEITTLLLARGADPNGTGYAKNTPLLASAGSFHSELIPLLIAHGAHIDAQNDRGETPLIAAAAYCAPWNVAALLSAGANPKLTDSMGRTALQEIAFMTPMNDGKTAPCKKTRELLEAAIKK